MHSAQKRSKILTCLQRSQREAAIVRYRRAAVLGKRGGHQDREAFYGVVLDRGPEWVLFAVLRDGGYPNGYSVVRLRDITEARLAPVFQEFVESRDPWPLIAPEHPLDLSETGGLLQSVAKNAAVYELYEEERRLGHMWICSPQTWRKRSVWVRMIDPDGRWDAMWTNTRFKHVTRIDFLGDYCCAMEQMAGPNPDDAASPVTA